MSIDNFSYRMIRNNSSRSIRITVRHTGEVRVSAPQFMPQFMVDRFVAGKKDWIARSQEQFLKYPVSPYTLLLRKRNRREYLARKDEAMRVLAGRMEYFNKLYGFQFVRIAIRNQKSRWGSCSRKGNINFNYKLLFLPPELRDYIVVHELCHIKELNHSASFWKLVEQALPDYRNLRKKLRGIQ